MAMQDAREGSSCSIVGSCTMSIATITSITVRDHIDEPVDLCPYLPRRFVLLSPCTKEGRSLLAGPTQERNFLSGTSKHADFKTAVHVFLDT